MKLIIFALKRSLYMQSRGIVSWSTSEMFTQQKRNVYLPADFVHLIFILSYNHFCSHLTHLMRPHMESSIFISACTVVL